MLAVTVITGNFDLSNPDAWSSTQAAVNDAYAYGAVGRNVFGRSLLTPP